MRLAAALLLAWCALAWGQQYRWIDERGGVQYSDVPPPASARNVQRKNLGGGQAQASQTPAVTLYTSPNCEIPCRDARRVLDDRGVSFREISVLDEASLAELKRATGAEQIPALLVGAQALVGLSLKGWNTALDSAGYAPAGMAAAKSRALPPVTLYTNSECGPLCAEARSYLQSQRVPFTEVQVEEPAAVAKLRDLTGQQNVPVLTVGKVVQRGYDPGLYARALSAGGFSQGSK